LFLINIRLVKG